MDIAERVSTLRQVNSLSARQLAALVDVAPTTITRIEAGAVSPSFDLAQELMVVLGEPIGFTAQADMSAMAAARLALDPQLKIDVTAAINTWWRRWARIGLVDQQGRVTAGKEADLLFRAGRLARLTRRPDAVSFKPGPGATELARRFGSAGVDYAVTGDAGANLYRPSAAEAWPVIYVDDIDAAKQAGALVPTEPGSFGSRITLIPFDGVSELGRTKIDGITVAARDQVILDAYGGIDRMGELGDILLGLRVI